MGSCGSHSCWELCRQRHKVFTKERIRFLSQPTMPDDEAGGGSPVHEQRDPGPRGRGRGLPTAWYLRTRDGATKARPAPRMGVRTPGDGPAGRAQAPAAPRDSGRRDSSSATSPPWLLKFSGLSVWGEASRADKGHRQLLPFRRLTHRQHTGLPTEHPSSQTFELLSELSMSSCSSPVCPVAVCTASVPLCWGPSAHRHQREGTSNAEFRELSSLWFFFKCYQVNGAI